MSTAKKPLRIIPLARLICLKLYLLHVKDDERDKLTVEEVLSEFSISISRNLARSSLEILRKDQFVHRHGNAETGYRFSIKEEGILMIEKSLSKSDSDLTYFLEHGDDSIEDIAGIDAIFVADNDEVDASYWIPLDYDKNDPEFIEVLSVVDQALEKIRADNVYAARFPEERSRIIEILESGRDWLATKLPTKGQILDNLVKPFRSVASRFGSSVIGEISKIASQRLLDWLAKFY